MSIAEILEQSLAAIVLIHERVKPFMEMLEKSDTIDKQEKAKAEAAVALTLGTLRFMGKRLRGLGVEKDDPLREELNHIRRLIVKLQQQTSDNKESAKKKKRKASKEEETLKEPASKVKR